MKLGTTKDFSRGETSERCSTQHDTNLTQSMAATSDNDLSEAEVDSSNIDSSDSEEEEGLIVERRRGAIKQMEKLQSGTVGTRGKSLKIN